MYLQHSPTNSKVNILKMEATHRMTISLGVFVGWIGVGCLCFALFCFYISFYLKYRCMIYDEFIKYQPILLLQNT